MTSVSSLAGLPIIFVDIKENEQHWSIAQYRYVNFCDTMHVRINSKLEFVFVHF